MLTFGFFGSAGTLPAGAATTAALLAARDFIAARLPGFLAMDGLETRIF
jgi:hypothetical protein